MVSVNVKALTRSIIGLHKTRLLWGRGRGVGEGRRKGSRKGSRKKKWRGEKERKEKKREEKLSSLGEGGREIHRKR